MIILPSGRGLATCTCHMVSILLWNFMSAITNSLEKGDSCLMPVVILRIICCASWLMNKWMYDRCSNSHPSSLITYLWIRPSPGITWSVLNSKSQIQVSISSENTSFKTRSQMNDSWNDFFRTNDRLPFAHVDSLGASWYFQRSITRQFTSHFTFWLRLLCASGYDMLNKPQCQPWVNRVFHTFVHVIHSSFTVQFQKCAVNFENIEKYFLFNWINGIYFFLRNIVMPLMQ